jgi:hypothetical protein
MFLRNSSADFAGRERLSLHFHLLPHNIRGVEGDITQPSADGVAIDAGKWPREQTAAEPLRGRTATSMLSVSALK